MALSCSFIGAAGMVLLDMLVRIAPETPVLYLDMGLLFDATYRLIEHVRERYRIEPRAVRASRTVAQQAQHEDDALWERDPDRCCRLHKVQPLARALDSYDAWITGVRRAIVYAQTPITSW